MFDSKPISNPAGQAPCAVSGQVSWPQARGICGCDWQPFCPAEHGDYRHRQHHPEGRQGTGHQDWHWLHPDRRHHQRELDTYIITMNSKFSLKLVGLDDGDKIVNVSLSLISCFPWEAREFWRTAGELGKWCCDDKYKRDVNVESQRPDLANEKLRVIGANVRLGRFGLEFELSQHGAGTLTEGGSLYLKMVSISPSSGWGHHDSLHHYSQWLSPVIVKSVCEIQQHSSKLYLVVQKLTMKTLDSLVKGGNQCCHAADPHQWSSSYIIKTLGHLLYLGVLFLFCFVFFLSFSIIPGFGTNLSGLF